MSFYQEASYLYFPTLQAELASDISFYFKTSAPSGVFLENQGLKDFIRVELAGESMFSEEDGFPYVRTAAEVSGIFIFIFAGCAVLDSSISPVKQAVRCA